MVRIGGKGMSYIVKNCPAILPMTKLCDSESIFNCGTFCKDCTNCVIKQVIQVCKREVVINYPKKEKEFITVNGYQVILNMFDIEEINK